MVVGSAVALAGCVHSTTIEGGGAVVEKGKTLTAKDLVSGLDARKVVLEGEVVKVDPYAFKFGDEKKGVIVTDVLDLGPTDGIVALPAKLEKVTVDTTASVAEGASVSVEIRTGSSFFDQSKWSKWVSVGLPSGEVTKLAGRYAQLRVVLVAASETAAPTLSKIELNAVSSGVKALEGVEVTDAKIEQIVNSTIDFKYERPDQEKIVKFKNAINIDAIVKDKKTDVEKLATLMEWVASCNNDRTRSPFRVNGRYTWDIEKLSEVTRASKGGDDIGELTIFGHCMSYSQVMSIACTALGLKSRHMAVVGFRRASHEVDEVWVPSLKKWVYYDPSLSNYYMDKDTDELLNLLEMHDIVADNFVPEGKNMNWFIEQHSKETREVVKKVGGQKPIKAYLGKWYYGSPMKANYDWGWQHGYLISGFVQMTPRTDFHAHPEAIPPYFEHEPGYAGYPFWVDAKTPPRKGVKDWFRRKRDFYWTVDQASLVLSGAADGGKTLSVELGNSMPFFKSYKVEVNGKAVSGAANPFVWKLESGKNTLVVTPVDEFGQAGAASSVAVTLK